MFKTQVTYNDFNDKTRTEELYFHIMAPELADLQFNPDLGGDLSSFVKTAMASGDMRKVYTFFKLLIVNSYGRRSEDGSEFIKKPEYTEQFLNSRAYEEFFMKLIGDHKFAENFWSGIMPEKVLEKISELEQQNEGSPKKSPKDMTKEELVALLQKKIDEKGSTTESIGS